MRMGVGWVWASVVRSRFLSRSDRATLVGLLSAVTSSTRVSGGDSSQQLIPHAATGGDVMGAALLIGDRG